MNEFLHLMPEIFLVLTLAGVIAGEIAYHGERIRLISLTTLVGLTAALIQVFLGYQFSDPILIENRLVVDHFSLFFKMIFIGLSILIVIVSLYTKEIDQSKRAEYYAFITAAALSMCLAASAIDLIVVFLVLLLMNVLTFFLVGFSKKDIRSTEAAVKYMIFSMISGAFFLYGSAILFLKTRTLNLFELQEVLGSQAISKETGLVIFSLLFLSLCFYIAAFPMYLWLPDSLEGAPIPTSIFLALGVPTTGFVVGLRMFSVFFAQGSSETSGFTQVLGGFDWTSIVALASGITMGVGSLLAFRQGGAKRMLACLVVAQSGFLLMGLMVLNQVGVSALLFNLLVNLFSLVGVFTALSFLFDSLGSDRLKDFRGVFGRAVPESLCLLLFLACFVGFPPLPGFIGKFVLIGAVVQQQWYMLAILAVGSTVLSAASFAKFAYSLAGDYREAEGKTLGSEKGQRLFLFLLLIPILLLSIFADVVLNWASQSLQGILW